MKKLSIMCALVWVVSLTAGSVFAVQYCKDYLEDGNPGGWTESSKTFEEGISLKVNDAVLVDVWINDLRPDVNGQPDWVISGAFEASWSSNVTVVNVTPYDKENGGPWDPDMTNVDFTVGSNAVNVIVGQLACVPQDAGGDVLLAKIEIKKVGEGTGTITFIPIPGFNAFVSCVDSHTYDPEISANSFTINGGGCETNGDCDDGLYCNGDEICAEGICQGGTDPCLNQTCNEDTNSCESTTHSTTTTTPHTGTTTSTMTISSTTSTTSSSWKKFYNELWGAKKGENLSLLRSFRDEVLANSELGRNYTSMLYNNSREILTLLIQNPSLTEETKNITDELLPGIQSLLDGGEMILYKRQLASIESLFTQFEIMANPELKTAIKKMRGDLSEGKLFEQLKIHIVNDLVMLPASSAGHPAN